MRLDVIAIRHDVQTRSSSLLIPSNTLTHLTLSTALRSFKTPRSTTLAKVMLEPALFGNVRIMARGNEHRDVEIRKTDEEGMVNVRLNVGGSLLPRGISSSSVMLVTFLATKRCSVDPWERPFFIFTTFLIIRNTVLSSRRSGRNTKHLALRRL